MNTTLTQDQTQRLLSAVAECDRLIAKEQFGLNGQARNPALRPAAVQQMLDHAIIHRQRLINTLAGAEGGIKLSA